MPNGWGFAWPGHSAASARALLGHIAIGSGPDGLFVAAQTAVRRLAGADGIAVAGNGTGGRPAASSSEDLVLVVVAAVALLAVALGVGFAVRRRRRAAPAKTAPAEAAPANPTAGSVHIRRLVPLLALLFGVAVAVPIAVASLLRHAPATALSAPPANSLATPFTWPAGRRRAPGFRLSDQNGRPVSLAAYRGRPVIVTFVDPLCRSLCPLEAHVLNNLVALLPPSRRPAILAVSVDVYADSRADLMQDFRRWQLVPQWRWGVGRPAQLAAIWNRYAIEVDVVTKTVAGTTVHSISHTEGAYVIDAAGYERALFLWPFTAQDVETALQRLG